MGPPYAGIQPHPAKVVRDILLAQYLSFGNPSNNSPDLSIIRHHKNMIVKIWLIDLS